MRRAKAWEPENQQAQAGDGLNASGSTKRKKPNSCSAIRSVAHSRDELRIYVSRIEGIMEVIPEKIRGSFVGSTSLSFNQWLGGGG